MKKIRYRKYLKLAKAFFVKHSADILTGFTAAGVVVTAIETRKATLKAEAYIYNTVDSNASPETRKAVERQTYKFYAMPAICGAATIASAIGSNYINHKEIATLAAACSAAEMALEEHRDKIEELLGAKELQKVDDSILEDRGKEFMAKESPVYDTGHGEVLCIDGESGIRFRACPDWIMHCKNLFNEKVNEETYASYGEFLELLLAPCGSIYIPEKYYGKGYNVHINGILRLVEEPHWDGGDTEKYMIYKPYNNPVANFMDIL